MADASTIPIYVLHGSDGYLRDSHRKRILHELLGNADPQTCVTTFDATAELAPVLDELRTLPFLAPHRVVIITDADAFVSANRDALEKYLQNPSRNGTLMLMVNSWRSNMRIAKQVAKVGQAIDCSAPDARSLPKWLKDAFARRDKRINNDAAELLAEWVGTDLAALQAEVDKLATYVGQRKTVTVADVGTLVTNAAGPAAFALTNAITDGDTRAALGALDRMLRTRGEEFRTLGMLAWHLRKAVSAQQTRAAGGDPSRSLRLPYPQKQAFLAMLKRRDLRKLQKDFRRLIEADLALKSGASAELALQKLVVEMCS